MELQDSDAQNAVLVRVAQLEAQMERERQETQQRLDAMARILALADPHEQLAEYLALRLDGREASATTDTTADVARELLECARQLPAGEDSDVALLAAFFFSCDASPPSAASRDSRSIATLLPAAAAMMERAASLDHHPGLL